MRKKLLYLLRGSFILIAVFFLFGRIHQTEALINPNVNKTVSEKTNKDNSVISSDVESKSGLFGQDHYYTVLFRGNGEAVVVAKIIFTNTDNKVLKTLKLDAGNAILKNIQAFQVLKKPICVRYKYYDYDSWGRQKRLYDPICKEYRKPRFDDYISSYNSTYRKTDVNTEMSVLNIQLNNPVKSNSSGAILLYFTTQSYTRKNIFDKYSFVFTNLKTNYSINKLRIGVDVDSEYKIKGLKGKIKYNNSKLLGNKSFVNNTFGSVGSPVNYREGLNKIYSSIGYGSLAKTVSNLQPYEVYKLKGSYADSYLKLYLNEIIIGVVVVLLVLALLFVLVRFLVKKLTVMSSAQSLGKKGNNQKNSSPTQRLTSSRLQTQVIVALGFIDALFLAAYTVISFLLFLWLRSELNSTMLLIFILMSASFSLFVYSLFTLVPAFYLWYKKDLRSALVFFVSVVIWGLIIVTLIGTLFFFLVMFTSHPTYPYPRPVLY